MTNILPSVSTLTPKERKWLVFALRRFGCSRYRTLSYNLLLPELLPQLGITVDHEAAIAAVRKACAVYKVYPQVAAFRRRRAALGSRPVASATLADFSRARLNAVHVYLSKYSPRSETSLRTCGRRLLASPCPSRMLAFTPR